MESGWNNKKVPHFPYTQCSIDLWFFLISFFSVNETGPLYPLGWLMAAFVVLGNVNAIQRLRDTWKDLGG